MTLRYINHFNHLLDDLEQHSLKRTLKICDSASAPIMKIDGQAMLTFCSNDYLGLANHPDLAKAITEGLQRFGSGSGASHMISGHHRPHDQLEKALAKTQEAFIPEVRALFFSTGYMANLAAITAISSSLGSNQVMSIYSEELNHASLIDGVRLASKQNQANVQVFPHQDLQALEQLLAKDTNEFKLIVTDGVFSMDGDIADIPWDKWAMLKKEKKGQQKETIIENENLDETLTLSNISVPDDLILEYKTSDKLDDLKGIWIIAKNKQGEKLNFTTLSGLFGLRINSNDKWYIMFRSIFCLCFVF